MADPKLDHITEVLRHLAVPLADLTLDPKNARVHDNRNIDAIKKSLTRFGQRLPIVVQKTGMVVRAGNGRTRAAREMGWTHIAAVITDDADEMAAAFAVADNRTAELAKWDQEKLGEVIIDIRECNIDIDTEELISAMSFSDKDLSKIVNAATYMRTDTVQDDVPEPPQAAVVRDGELWGVGQHRIICGDARDQDLVARLFGDREQPKIMVTDPPYGVCYDASWREEKLSGTRSTGVVFNDDIVDWSEAMKLFPGDVAYVWHGALKSKETQESIEDIGFEVRAQIIWVKQHFAISRGSYHWQHEPCWYAVRKGRQASWIGDRKQTTIMNASNASAFGGEKNEYTTNHSTQKPIECMARFIRHHQGSVYDPFLGSGTTIIAAHQLDRSCFGIEIDPGYCDVIIKRAENFTGEKARRL